MPGQWLGKRALVRLTLAYGAIILAAVLADRILRLATAWIHPNATVIVDGVTVVYHGIARSSLYRDELVWYTAMCLLLATIAVLMHDDSDALQQPLRRFLTSRKVNMMVGTLFIFCALGLTFSKAVPDPILNALTVVNLVVIGLIVVRVLMREVYVRLRGNRTRT